MYDDHGNHNHCGHSDGKDGNNASRNVADSIHSAMDSIHAGNGGYILNSCMSAEHGTSCT